jgi:AmmeMemoRadiSam system protein A
MDSLTDSERRHLLEVARQAVRVAAEAGRHYEPVDSPERLREKRAVFVSLHKRGELRGCIGSTAARLPLDQAVADAAYSAAMQDPRFDPVTAGEVPLIDVEISVLSPFVEIRPEEIVVGRHGLMVSGDFARGLLLPQVAEQRHWSIERFLEETCRKAGLPADAWKHGAKIQAFSAEVFGEHSDGKEKATADERR